MVKTVELIGRGPRNKQSAVIECEEAEFRDAVWRDGKMPKMTRPAEVSLRGLKDVRDHFRTQWTHLVFNIASNQEIEGSIYGRPALIADGVRIILHPVRFV